MPRKKTMLGSIVASLGPAEAVEFFMTLGAGRHRREMQIEAIHKTRELFVLKHHLEAVRVLIQVGLKDQALDAIKRALTAHPDYWDPVNQRLFELQEEALDLPGR